MEETDHSTAGRCPLCSNPSPKKKQQLYDHTTCRKCPIRFSRLREIAFVFDYVGLIAMTVVLGIAYVMISGDTDPNSVETGSLATAAWALFTLKDGIGGASIGKRMMGLRVIDDRTGERAGLRASFLRNLPVSLPMALLSFVPIAGMLGLIWIIILAIGMRRGPRLGDGWAHTRVVPVKKATHPVYAVSGEVIEVFE